MAEGSPLQPAEDWSDDQRIRAEWTSLEGAEADYLGWSNGTRGLAYTYMGQPLITTEQAAETVRRILRAISAMPPTVPAFQWQFAPKLVRLALAVTRQNRWQPESLGGDGTVGDDLLHPEIVLDSTRAPGVGREDRLRHFFSAPHGAKAG